jgi:uncharacterized protein with PIN domain
MGTGKVQCAANLHERQERLQAALIRLKCMKEKIADLSEQCEALKKTRTEKTSKRENCSKCSYEIEEGQEVVVKDSSGEPVFWYHKDCFRAIWSSEDWRVGYSSKGVLGLSRKDH